MRSNLPRYLLLITFFVANQLNAEQPKIDINVQRVKPKTAGESLKSFVVANGLKVELVAAEPLVQSPMFAEFDELGRMWVIELPEYNAYGGTKPQGQGRIVVLTDTNHDGQYDQRTVFADRLDYPTGLACWNGGVYVGVAPDLVYMKDTNQDGVADVKEVILTGFGKDKAGEAHLNSFRWTPEQRILISTGMNGGLITVPGKPDIKPVSVRNLNILLDPKTNQFEITSGGGQHGMSLDDWGNVFVCGNSDPIMMLMYDARFILGNPLLNPPAAAVNILPTGKFTKLNRVSEIEPWRQARTSLRKAGLVPGSDEGGTPSGFFTGATGITVYRGDALPEEYRGNVFVGEVANNLVFRAKLQPKGVGLEAMRADETSEFLASRDVWFRPAQMANAPDGCLYIVDMYRELIEGAAFLPPDVLKQLDVAAGFDQGRIWRIVPERHARRQHVNLANLKTEELVKLLEHPNGWHRDVASRLLYQRGDRSIADSLETMMLHATLPQTKVVAMNLLERLVGAVQFGLSKDVQQQSTHVRQQMLMLYGRRMLNKPSGTGLPDVNRAIPFRISFLQGYQDRHASYRYHYAMVAGQQGDPFTLAPEYTQLAINDSADPWMQLAILAGQENFGRAKTFAELLLSREFRSSKHGRALLSQMAAMLAADPSGLHTEAIMKGISTAAISDQALAREIYRAFKLRASPKSLARWTDPNWETTVKGLVDRIVGDAVITARDTKKMPAQRIVAIQDLTLLSFQDVLPILKECLQPTEPPEVQRAVLETLGKFGHESTPAILLDYWKGMSPSVRATATEVFLSKNDWILAFLDAVEAKKIQRADVDPARIELLKKSPLRAIGIRTAKVFGNTTTNRQEVVEQYRPSLQIKGDVARGKIVFKNQCAACHQLDGIGENIGADLNAIKDRGLESVLLNILDPNREVKPQYLTYSVELKSGRLITGMIIQESANGITIRKSDGTNEILSRTDVEQMRSSGLSFMPEGLEKLIDRNSMADLLAFLSSIKPSSQRSE